MHRVDGCYAAIWLWACSGDALAMLFRSGSCRGLLLAVVAAIARCCPWLICIVRPIGRLNPWCPPQPPLVPPPSPRCGATKSQRRLTPSILSRGLSRGEGWLVMRLERH